MLPLSCCLSCFASMVSCHRYIVHSVAARARLDESDKAQALPAECFQAHLCSACTTNRLHSCQRCRCAHLNMHALVGILTVHLLGTFLHAPAAPFIAYKCGRSPSRGAHAPTLLDASRSLHSWHSTSLTSWPVTTASNS